MVNTTTLLGVVLLARHGDRVEFFQDPFTYNPAQTFLTALGSVQEQDLGAFLRATYLDPSSPTAIDGIDADVADINQLDVRADAGGEGAVILTSVQGLLQGLFPPTTDNNITLANGTTVVAPLGGYQAIPVESVEPNEDISLEGFTSCPNFDNHISEFYASSSFMAEATEAKPFLELLQPYLGNRSIDFVNMYNIFDFVNVQLQHNATFLAELPPTYGAQAYYYANFHENGVFTDGTPDGIGNIAIRTVLPSIFTSLTRIANASDPLKLALSEISYKPFISLFNVTQATIADPGIAGIVDYAATVAFEVHAPATPSDEPTVNMRFKNGTSDPSFHDLTLFGAASLPLSQFISQLAPSAVNTTQQWCTVCNQTTLRGCSVFFE
ncbi:phosphoglycerate mutase-like protein [Cubamyces lactineus]|nr:phosphoglycerate mutase-like protein [Cubamyces lactineus]